MMPFRRQPAPAAWSALEEKWRSRASSMTPAAALHKWRCGGQSAAAFFHATVRAPAEPSLCAYCDGDLGPTSPPVIDHFLPHAQCRALGLEVLGLAWTNLFPCCTTCNTTFKRDRWSCLLLRPDVDDVAAQFACDVQTGELSPAPELDRAAALRVKKTIRILGLNSDDRCRARRRVLRELQKALVRDDRERVAELFDAGPYRFLARSFLLPACESPPP
jgi:uncharacterized protein (TIGR02646 family)